MEYRLDFKVTEKFVDVSDNITQRMQRFYYEQLDKAIIENMPDELLESLYSQIIKERERRGPECSKKD